MKKTLMKKLRSGLALLMAVSLASGTCGTVLAAGATNEDNSNISYVSLGDSMANGYGLPGYETDGEVNGYLQIAPDAYPSQVAEEMGWDLTQLAISAMRAEDLHFILEYGAEGAYPGDYYTEDEFVDGRFDDFLDVEGKENLGGVENVAAMFQDSVSNADVISVGIGNANFGVFLLGRITNALGVLGDNPSGDAWINLDDALAECDEQTRKCVKEVYAMVLDALIEQTGNAELSENLARPIAYTIISYVLNYNGVLDRIVELNPDAEIILVGIMNTMSGLDVTATWEGKTYTIDMGTILAPVIESVNLYIAALPAAKQALDVYPEAEFYYAEATNVEMIVNDMADSYKTNDIVRDRIVDEVCDTVFPVLNMGLADITLADVKAYEAAAASSATLAAYVANEENLKKVPAIAAYLAFEDAVVASTGLEALDANSFATLANNEALEALFTELKSVVAGNTAAQAAAHQNTAVEVVAYGIVAGSQGQVTLEQAKELAQTEEYKADITNLCTLLATPKAMSDALKADDTIMGLLNLFARMLVGNGIGCHPNAAGHDTLTDAIVESYNGKYTATDAVTDKVVSAMEDLYDLLVEYGPDAIEGAYAYAEKMGYIDDLKNAANDLITEAETQLKNFEEEVRPEIEAAIEELETQLEALKEELAAKEAELENASEELKAEIEAAIEEIEKAIDILEDAIAELEQELDAIAEELEAFGEAAEELKAAVEELIQITSGEVEGSVEEAIAKVQAAVANVGEAVANAETLAEAVNTVINGAVELAGEMAAVAEEMKEVIDKVLEDTGVADRVAEAAEELKAAAEQLYEEAVTQVQQIVDRIVDEFNAAYVDATTDEYTASGESYYVALGDSSAVAFGLDTNDEYGYRLAEELGLDVNTQYKNLSEHGMSAEDCYAVLETNAEDIAKADLITIGFGNNSFVTFVAEQLMAATTGRTPAEMDWSSYVGEDGVAYIEQALEEVKAYFLESGMDATYAELMTLAVESYAYGYVGYACNYTEVINDIHEMNPEALVIIVGMYNPLEGVVIDVNGTDVAIGEYVGYLVDLANLHNTAYAMLTPNTIYVDAPAVETIKNITEMNVMAFIAEYVNYKGESVHASENGHEYIKNQILKALSTDTKYLLGDVNLDGTVNASDVNLVYRHAMQDAALPQFSGIQLLAADVNQDGAVNASDVNVLYRYTMKDATQDWEPIELVI